VIDTTILAVLLFLLVASILDAKLKAIPSMFLSGAIIVLAIVMFDNLAFGILALAYGLFLMDADFMRGKADLKVMVIIGLMITSLYPFLIMMLLVVFFGVAFKFGIYFVAKPKRDIEVPFVPILFIVYVSLVILRLI